LENIKLNFNFLDLGLVISNIDGVVKAIFMDNISLGILMILIFMPGLIIILTLETNDKSDEIEKVVVLPKDDKVSAWKILYYSLFFVINFLQFLHYLFLVFIVYF